MLEKATLKRGEIAIHLHKTNGRCADAGDSPPRVLAESKLLGLTPQPCDRSLVPLSTPPFASSSLTGVLNVPSGDLLIFCRDPGIPYEIGSIVRQDVVPLLINMDVTPQGPKQYGLFDVNASAMALNKVDLTERMRPRPRAALLFFPSTS